MLLSLPDDILSELFDVLAQLDPPRSTPALLSSRSRPESWKLLGWIKLTHVSRYLREIGLRRATLWARDVTVFPAALNILLERSRDAPLTLRLDGPGLRSDAVTTVIQAQLHRTRELYDQDTARIIERDQGGALVSRQPRRDWESILAGRAMPSLEFVSFSGWHTGKSSDPVNIEKPFIAPALRSYMMHKFLPFSAPSLRELALYDRRLKWTHYLDIIEACPLLTHVTIIGGLWSTLGEEDVIQQGREGMEESELETALGSLIASSGSRTIAMGHLKRMHIEGGFEAYILLHHLSLPSSAAVNVAAYDRTSRFRGFASLLEAQLRHPTRDVLVLSRSLHPEFLHRIDQSTSVSLGESQDGWSWPSTIEGITMTLKSTPWTPLFDPVPSQWNYLPPEVAQRIKTLAIERDTGDDDSLSVEQFADWWAGLNRFSAVTTLYIRRDFQPIFALLNAGSLSHRPLLPKLHTIVIYAPPYEQALSPTLWVELICLLGARKGMGHPVTRVVLTGRACHLVDEGLSSTNEQTGEAEYYMEKLRPEALNGLVEEVIDEREKISGGCDCATRRKPLKRRVRYVAV
ncbi:unnamed protein product [Peniophora sp. CBMAI 1063]|nr:unnamed protein product [Peniophora sp. CBMAI 1063]